MTKMRPGCPSGRSHSYSNKAQDQPGSTTQLPITPRIRDTKTSSGLILTGRSQHVPRGARGAGVKGRQIQTPFAQLTGPSVLPGQLGADTDAPRATPGWRGWGNGILPPEAADRDEGRIRVREGPSLPGASRALGKFLEWRSSSIHDDGDPQRPPRWLGARRQVDWVCVPGSHLVTQRLAGMSWPYPRPVLSPAPGSRSSATKALQRGWGRAVRTVSCDGCALGSCGLPCPAAGRAVCSTGPSPELLDPHQGQSQDSPPPWHVFPQLSELEAGGTLGRVWRNHWDIREHKRGPVLGLMDMTGSH